MPAREEECRQAAGLALLLACIGFYGVMAYRAVGRTHEIGIRLAIGARQQSVVWMMVRETLLLVTIGAALGTLSSLGVNRFIAAQLFGVTPRDPVAIVVALSVLGCVTLIAGYLPARHASRIDPVKPQGGVRAMPLHRGPMISGLLPWPAEPSRSNPHGTTITVRVPLRVAQEARYEVCSR